ncbi:MAG: hypothetical protein HGA90_05870 [Alphaproteobacteria bacterium]|nr:hypothetical protein [Alphaproteobacteria bacterium]
MALRDLLRNTLVTPSLAPAVRTNGTATGAAVDLRGFDAAVIAVAFGACTDGTHTPSVQHSVDGTTYTNAAASDLDGAFVAVTSGSGANAVQTVGYIGSQRYVRVVITTTGATTGALSAANVLSGYPRHAPTQ